MVEVDESKIKEAENAIRDLINWVEVWNLEQIEGGVKKIEDETVDDLKKKLEDIAKKVSGLRTVI
jgi:predicted transcriptional regulator